MLIKDIVNRIKEISPDIQKNYKAKIYGVFGSYARGDEKENSDLDVLVQFDESVQIY